MPEFDPVRLDTDRDDLRARYDVAVIGGGVNGLAVAREAALSGLSVILLERDDLGAHTSSISTRLIHGGLKYLERLDIALVLESVREQRRLLDQAPHLVRPYPMLIPFYRSNSRPGWLIACGLAVLKVLAKGRIKARPVGSRRLGRDWPSLAARGLRWGVVFDDAQVPWTERLCVELALSARAAGAHLLTRVEVTDLVGTSTAVHGVRCVGPSGERTVVASVVVNAAGPWVDSVLAAAGDARRPLVGPTKGSHVIVDPFPGAPDTCVFFEARSDRRPMFVLPWADRYMIGCTDLPYAGSLDGIAADDAEIDYLLTEANTVIPAADLSADDVLWSYAGVRPLPFVDDLTDPAKITRGHQVLVGTAGRTNLVTVVGGKLTTHRALGEDVVGTVFDVLGRRRVPSPTRGDALPGAPAAGGFRTTADVARMFDRIWGTRLDRRVRRRLLSLYGVRAVDVAALIDRDPELAEVVDPETGAVAAEVVFAVEHEGAVSLEDIMLRRMVVGLNGDVGVSSAQAIADAAHRHLGWTAERARREVADYMSAIARFRPRKINVPLVIRQYPDSITGHAAS